MRTLRRFWPFLSGVLGTWLSLIILFIILDRLCIANPGCSGEFGVTFVFLAIPWVAFLMDVEIFWRVIIGLMINSIIVGLLCHSIYMVCRWAKKRLP